MPCHLQFGTLDILKNVRNLPTAISFKDGSLASLSHEQTKTPPEQVVPGVIEQEQTLKYTKCNKERVQVNVLLKQRKDMTGKKRFVYATC